VKSEKLRGFSAKNTRACQFDRYLPDRLDIDPLDLDPTAAGGSILNGRGRSIGIVRS
jgi:hypothetical protein